MYAQGTLWSLHIAGRTSVRLTMCGLCVMIRPVSLFSNKTSFNFNLINLSNFKINKFMHIPRLFFPN